MERVGQEWTFLWVIENYSYCPHENGESLKSPTFITKALDGTAWDLFVYPRGIDIHSKSHVSLCLHRSEFDEGPAQVQIKCELSALASDASLLKSENSELIFYKSGSGYGSYDFLKRGEIFSRRKNDCLPQDTLTLRCKIWYGEGNLEKFEPVCARTRIGMQKVSFLHEVENFSKMQPNEFHTVRKLFNSGLKKIVLSSRFFIRDSFGNEEMFIEISTDYCLFLCQRKISLVDGSGNRITCGEDDYRLIDYWLDYSKLPLSLTRQDILSNERKYLTDGKLTLLCECVFSTGLDFNRIEDSQCEMSTEILKQETNPEFNKQSGNTKENASAYPSGLEDTKEKASAYRSVLEDTKEKATACTSGLEDMKDLYVNQCLTDVQLKTETKCFPAHKVVLCARSPVFKAMLTNDMKKKNNGCIQVDDLEDDVMQKFLLFLYSDTVENLDWTLATRLLYAADKYQVGKLRELCSSFLLKKLTPSSAGELLLIADTHGDTDLKKSVENYILKHEVQVFGSEEWERLVKTNPILAANTMQLKYKIKKEND